MANNINLQSINNSSQEEVEIDLLEIFSLLLRWIWLILIAAVLCGGIAFAYAKFVLPEEFQSTTTVYILNKSENSGTVTQTEMQAGAQLTKDYSQLITSRTVLENVMQQLGLEGNYTYNEFKEKVSVNTPTDTRLINITVTDTDPETAQKIADQIRIVASEHIQNVMQIEAVNLVDAANLPTRKSAPSVSRWTMIGALIGALIVSAWLIIRYILDDTIKTSDDVEKYLGLSTLALIPLDANVSGNNNKKKKSKKKKEPSGSGSSKQETAPAAEAE